MSVVAALDRVEAWLARPQVRVVVAGPQQAKRDLAVLE